MEKSQTQMNRNCDNCAWYCHADHECYAREIGGWSMRLSPWNCEAWSFDGLEDWEREPEALMTMEAER